MMCAMLREMTIRKRPPRDSTTMAAKVGHLTTRMRTLTKNAVGQIAAAVVPLAAALTAPGVIAHAASTTEMRTQKRSPRSTSLPWRGSLEKMTLREFFQSSARFRKSWSGITTLSSSLKNMSLLLLLLKRWTEALSSMENSSKSNNHVCNQNLKNQYFLTFLRKLWSNDICESRDDYLSSTVTYWL